MRCWPVTGFAGRTVGALGPAQGSWSCRLRLRRCRSEAASPSSFFLSLRPVHPGPPAVRREGVRPHRLSLGGELSPQVLCPAQAHQGAPFLTSGLAWPLPQLCGSVLVSLRWSRSSLMGRSWASFLLRRSRCTVLSHRFLSADLCSRGSRERPWSWAGGRPCSLLSRSQPHLLGLPTPVFC